MAEEVHKSDVGTKFRVTLKDASTVVDISAATTKEIHFYKPDGTTLEKTATLYTDGSDGIMEYTTVAGDIDQTGTWRIQAYIVTSSGSWKSSVEQFVVYENLV